MKHIINKQRLSFISTFLVGLTLIQTVQADTLSLATEPLLSKSTTSVKPNIMFIMDNSGSMTFTYLPSQANDFAPNQSGSTYGPEKYGYLSNHCNRAYYTPLITYDVPIRHDAPVDGEYTDFPDSNFEAAHDDGFDSSSTTRNLNTSFAANRFVPESANDVYWSRKPYKQTIIGDGHQGVVYYQYTGSVTERDYDNTSSAFYTECNTPISNYVTVGRTRQIKNGTVFQKHRLSSDMTTTIRVDNTGGTATVSSITVNGYNILNSTTSASNSASGVASSIANRINAKNDAYDATVSGATVTITGPASAAGYWPQVNSNNMHFEVDVFPESTAAELTNFANWYSYYRARMLMMKTSAGRSFGTLDDKYRLGYMEINGVSSDGNYGANATPNLGVSTFAGTGRQQWFNQLYSAKGSGGTPLRNALSVAGRYYAGKFTSKNDPIQYSCQQNFTILSSDGYWSGTNAGTKLDGVTDVGNQDGVVNGVVQADRPQFDGTSEDTNTSGTVIYRRYKYEKVRHDCRRGKRSLQTIEERASCEYTSGGSCAAPTNASAWSVYDESYSRCSSSRRIRVPLSPSATEVVSNSSNAGSAGNGGQANTLADVAQYYYITDLRDELAAEAAAQAAKDSTPDVATTTEVNESDAAFNAAMDAACNGGTREDGEVGDVCQDNVVGSVRDNNKEQHMTTFSLGLGVNGVMKFVENYENVAGDYRDIRYAETASATKCTWETAGEKCNWPNGMTDNGGGGVPKNVDDLWHAAVNGRGTYFSAEDPQTLTRGLSDALSGIGQRRGSAAAASSSSLNPVEGNNSAFIASFTNKVWTGNLEARPINTRTAAISRTATWCAETIPKDSCASNVITTETVNNSTVTYCELPLGNNCVGEEGASLVEGNNQQVCKVEIANECTGTFTTRRKDENLTVAEAMVSANSDNRTIYTRGEDGDGNIQLVDFDNTFDGYYSSAVLSGLSQWPSLTASQKSKAEANMVGYLRGHYAYDQNSENLVTDPDTGATEDNRLFRERNTILGDILESKPTYSSKSLFKYTYPGYTAFKETQNSDSDVIDGTIYVGANDGMLHAINAQTGKERWAYIPSMVLPGLWRLADENYSADGMHRNFINGTPAVADVCVADCDADDALWKTIAVVGLNGGGRGYFALDITDPTTPKLLWEFKTGTGQYNSNNLGYSFAKPVITRTKVDGEWTWVVLVTSGYNNTSPGDGKGHLFVLGAADGELHRDYVTSAGDTSDPSGLGKISAWNSAPSGNEANYVYAGDLEGNLWRFNLNIVKDDGDADDIAIDSAVIDDADAVFKFAVLLDDDDNPQPITTKPLLASVNSNRTIFVSTGKLLEGADVTTAIGTQTVYAIKDDFGPDANSGIADLRDASGEEMIEQVIQEPAADNPNFRGVTNDAVNWASDRGWYADLPDEGERINLDGFISQGVLVVPSTVPTSTACKPDGYSWLNYFDIETGGPIEGFVGERFDTSIAGIGGLSIDGETTITVMQSNGDTASGSSTLTGKAGAFTGKRTLWRELLID